jgi:hypothetical protein
MFVAFLELPAARLCCRGADENAAGATAEFTADDPDMQARLI